MAKVQLDLNKAVFTPESIVGNLSVLGVEISDRYNAKGDRVDAEPGGAIFKLASDLQGREIPISFAFYKYQSDELAMPRERMEEILNVAKTAKFMTPVELVGFSMKQANETHVRSSKEDGKWVENKVNIQLFDVTAETIRLKKVATPTSHVNNANAGK